MENDQQIIATDLFLFSSTLGKRLTQLMIDYGIGMAEVAKYIVKRVDQDYFGDD